MSDHAEGAHYFEKGLASYRNETWKEAAEHFTQAIRLHCPHDHVYFYLGVTYFRLGSLKLSEKMLQEALSRLNDHSASRFFLACLYLETQQVSYAMPHFLALYEVNPNHFPTVYNLAQCAFIMRNWPLAEDYFLQANHLKSDEDALYNLAVVTGLQGKFTLAIAHYRDLLRAFPSHTAGKYNLALLLQKSEASLEEPILLLESVRDESPHFASASFLLSAWRQEGGVKEAPTPYLSDLFDQYASYYDAHMKTLASNVPLLLSAAWQCNRVSSQDGYRVLDFGCGTGLLGSCLQQIESNDIRSLIGVDVSLRMLECARQKNIYSKLLHVSGLDYLNANDDAPFDLIIASDSWVYVGDLSELLQAAAKVLAKDGRLVFNLEITNSINEDADYVLQTSGRFLHAEDYVTRLAHATAWRLISSQQAVLRHQDGAPVMGAVYVCALPDLPKTARSIF